MGDGEAHFRDVDDLTLSHRELPEQAVAARLERAAQAGTIWKVAEPRIAAVLGTCRAILQDLEDRHAGFADQTDLNLTRYSRDYGKTSLLKLLCERLSLQGTPTVIVDLYGITNSLELARRIKSAHDLLPQANGAERSRV